MLFLLAALTAYSQWIFVTPIDFLFLQKMKIGGPSRRSVKIHKNFSLQWEESVLSSCSLSANYLWGWQFPLPDIRYLIGPSV